MTARKKAKFHVGQIVVGIHSREYIARIKAVHLIGKRFRYQTHDGYEYGASDLRALTKREKGEDR